jgi:chemotaxis signal transduction protein
MTSTEDLLPHMRRVQVAERDMRELGLVWQTIESAAAISCPEEVATILPTLKRTRERFGTLQDRLIEGLAGEGLAELGDELTARARCAIDILVRNLYERTADVGFLATDDGVRAFCAADDATRAGLADAMRARLAEYRSKYTVYDDVILVAPDGGVLARLADGAGCARSDDPLIREALGATGYRERFGATDLVPGGEPSLLYANRVLQADGRVSGVLVLVFRFADELRRIFDGLADGRGQTALIVVDERDRVIASNDTCHVPIGSTIARIALDRVVLASFAGREYMAVCCETRGYQGYRGPAWRAQAMVSLLTAFRSRDDAGDADVPLDSAQLAAIQSDADEINRELRRVVWNGQLVAHAHGQGDRLRLKAVLDEVSVAGLRTRERVSLAVRDLYRTSLARARRQAAERARLAADIMDRNLYERANDCRWWALSPAIAERLARPASDATTAELCALLDRVNALYTVYSRLVAFDADGRVRGVSRADAAPTLLGRTVDAAWLDPVRRLAGTQRYAVTDFGPTDFHDAGDTYVYLAAVRDAGQGAPVGGIALIFDARAEFGAMLRDIVGERRGAAAFVDAGGRVIASSDPAVTVGDLLAFAADDAVVMHDGANWACARATARGYREFKVDDGYDNHVRALVALRLGPQERRRVSFAEESLGTGLAERRGAALRLGVFQVGDGRYALPADGLMQAVSLRGLVRAPSTLADSVGMLEIEVDGGPRMIRVICARRLFGVDEPARHGDGTVLVLRSRRDPRLPAFGLRVDDVLAVLEVDAARLQASPMAVHGNAVCGVVDCDLVVPSGRPARRALVQCLDGDALLAMALGTRHASALLPTEAATA